jgi:hypothetical protein
MLASSQIQVQNVANILAQCFSDDPSFAFVLGDYGDKVGIMTTFFEKFVTDNRDCSDCIQPTDTKSISGIGNNAIDG